MSVAPSFSSAGLGGGSGLGGSGGRPVQRRLAPRSAGRLTLPVPPGRVAAGAAGLAASVGLGASAGLLAGTWGAHAQAASRLTHGQSDEPPLEQRAS